VISSFGQQKPLYMKLIEPCSFACEKRFAFELVCIIALLLYDLHYFDLWLKNLLWPVLIKLAPLFHPIGSKISRKLSRNQAKLWLTQTSFPALCFISYMYIYFELWLVHWIICVICDCPEWLLWFYGTQLKPTLF